ncbi:retrotransposon protein, putative, ty1-copia subclass, partial [Tanacetum coccineum]
LTPPYTPQHNRVSERRNHTLLDMVRSMMNLTTLPLSLLDPESKRWVDAMNAEMQSMIDNMVWVLVDLPPNCKTIGSFIDPKHPRKVSKHQEAGIQDLMRKSKGLDLIKILMSHSAYMDKILKRFRMDTSKRGYIPIQERLDLNKSQGVSTPEEVKRMQNVPYASAVGSIMYVNPREPHRTAVKTILKYLRNTKDMFLVYGGNPSTELRWIGKKSSMKSTMAMSATESEYIAASEAAMEAVWIRKFISGLVHYDNERSSERRQTLSKTISLCSRVMLNSNMPGAGLRPR